MRRKKGQKHNIKNQYFTQMSVSVRAEGRNNNEKMSSKIDTQPVWVGCLVRANLYMRNPNLNPHVARSREVEEKNVKFISYLQAHLSTLLPVRFAKVCFRLPKTSPGSPAGPFVCVLELVQFFSWVGHYVYSITCAGVPFLADRNYFYPLRSLPWSLPEPPPSSAG